MQLENIGLMERSKIFADALNSALEIFTSDTDTSLGDLMSKSLFPIGNAVSLDRIIVFRVFGVENNSAGEIYRWDKSLGGTVPVDEALKALPITTALKRWVSIVSNDTCLSIRCSEFKDDEAVFLSPRDVKSILIVPVFTQGQFWGVVTFHDNTSERDFDEDCTALLRSTARLCANAIIREERAIITEQTMESLAYSKKLTDTLNKISAAMIQSNIGQLENTLYEGMGVITDSVNIHRVRIWKNITIQGKLHCTEVFEWSKGVERQKGNKYTVNVQYSEAIPGWEAALSQGEIINGPVSSMSAAVQAQLSPQGILSVLVVPVFFNSQFWGFVGFDDCYKERTFTENELIILHSAAQLWTGAVRRAEMENEISRAVELTGHMISEIEYQNRLLDSLNRISATVLQLDFYNFGSSINSCLGIMAEAVNVDRAYIWKNHIVDGRLVCTQIFEWSENAEPQQGSEYTVEISYDEHIPEWKERLSQGGCINARVRDMSLVEQEHLSPQGILSILLVSIYYQNQFWGFAGFDDCRNEREFLENEEMILRSASQLIANAVVRNETERKLADQNEFNRVMFEKAPIGLTTCDEDGRLLDCNDAILSNLGTTKQHYLEHFFDFSPEHQPDGQKSTDKMLNITRRALGGETFVTTWMHQTLKGEPIPTELLMTRVKLAEKFVGLGYVYDLRNINKMYEAVAEAEERASLLMEASPISYVLVDEDLCLVDCNSEAMRFFACSDKQHLLDNYWERFMPKTQPDGQNSLEKAKLLSAKSIPGKLNTFVWDYLSLYGEIIPAEISLTQFVYRDKKYVIAYIYDLRNIKRMEKNIKQLETEVDKIYFDALTGIHNRRFFEERLQRLINSLSRSGSYLSLMMVDVDFFKKYNDTYGHHEGDRCLKAIADILAQSVSRVDDFVARFGGEEFVLVLPNSDMDGAKAIAEKLLESVQKCNIPHSGNGVAGCVTVSIGVTTGRADKGRNADDFVKKADKMLYKSKQHGRNQYSFECL